MKKIFAVVSILVFTGFKVPEPELKISVVPKPAQTTIQAGVKQWKDGIGVYSGSTSGKVGSQLKNLLAEKKIYSAMAVKKQGDQNKISLTLSNDKSIPAEGYRLSIKHEGAQVTASSEAGLFYGAQTFVQLINEKNQTPLVEITDYPRFPYRGLHLDAARHMFPPEFIKKYIDLMARHKYNRFHWHLTDDQGWRIEIKKYPKLTEIGSKRKETAIGKATTKTRATVKYDGKPYGGFYTQEEIKDIVRYAAERYVTIIPEIEMPGHATAALAAYPNLGCTGGPYETATTWGVFTDIYCAGQEETFNFMQDVLDEVLKLFPGEYIHIGGDECPKVKWKECSRCQKRIADNNLKDEHGLQSYFIQRIEKYLNSKGRQIIGWDEILEGGLAPNATVMSWRGEEGGIAAAQQHHNVIMTPGQWVYLDYAQDTAKTEPLSIGGFTPVSKVYSYEPVPPQLTDEQSKYIIGAQCNVWSEYITTPEHAEYMVYPRASAMSEVLWSRKEDRNYDDFVERMKVHVQRLRDWKVNYAKHIEKEFASR